MGANSHGENPPHSLPAGRTGKLAVPLHRIPLVTLGNLFVMLLLGAAAAWWWRAHGVRERALLLAAEVDNPPVHSAEVIRLDEWRQSRQKKVGD